MTKSGQKRRKSGSKKKPQPPGISHGKDNVTWSKKAGDIEKKRETLWGPAQKRGGLGE